MIQGGFEKLFQAAGLITATLITNEPDHSLDQNLISVKDD